VKKGSIFRFIAEHGLYIGLQRDEGDKVYPFPAFASCYGRPIMRGAKEAHLLPKQQRPDLSGRAQLHRIQSSVRIER
jgi:hypothetical protein